MKGVPGRVRDSIAAFLNPPPPGGDVAGVKRVATLEPEPFYQPPPPPRHEDPGERFKPAPKPRTDILDGLPVRIGGISLNVPAGVQIEVRYQLPNGDWTPWRDVPAGVAAAGALARTVFNNVTSIAGQWRLKGNTTS